MADTTITYDDFVDGLTEEGSPANSDMLPTKKTGVTAKKTQSSNLAQVATNTADIASYRTSSAKSANYTILDDDGFDTIRMTTGSSADKTVTLPTAADNTDREITVLKADSGTNYLILDGEGAETLDYLGIQQVTITVELQGRGLRVKCNGTSWDIIEVIGAGIEDINGVLEMVYTKVLKGTLDNDSATAIAHGVDKDKILLCDGAAYDSTNNIYPIKEYRSTSTTAGVYFMNWDTTNVNFTAMGSYFWAQLYIVELRYYI